MEVLLPILFVVYIIASVISAIVKASQKGAAGTDQTSGPVPPGQADADIPVKPESDKSASSPQQRSAVETTSPTGAATMIWDEEMSRSSEEWMASSKDENDQDEGYQRQWASDERSHSGRSGALEGEHGMDEENWAEDYDWEWERPVVAVAEARKIVHPALRRPDSKMLIDGIIWSEVLKEPRAKRPWPGR